MKKIKFNDCICHSNIKNHLDIKNDLLYEIAQTDCERLNMTDKYYTDRPALPWPAKIQVYFNILDIVDIDWNSNTLTQFIQWNDSRIFVKEYDQR